MSRKPSAKRQQSEPTPELAEERTEPETSSPITAVEEQTEPVEEPLQESDLVDEPAQVQVTMKGSDRAVRTAAKRFGSGDQPQTMKRQPVQPAQVEETPPEVVDPIAQLLADGANMVIVTRQKPRTVTAPDGQEVPTNVRIHGRFTCPTTKSEIEEQVFEREGGSKYKCTIHPDTTDGETKILGHFTIEHPNPKCPPFIDGVTTNIPEPETQSLEIPTRGDPTMRETDPLAQMRAALQRRLERVQMKKEIEELESQINELEGKKESKMPLTAPTENDEVRKLREENAKLAAALAEKKTNDRFDKLESAITSLTQAIASKPAPAQEGESIIMKMMTQSQQHSKEMLDLIKSQNRPVAPADNFDAMLERLAKMKSALGKDDSRVSEFQERIMTAAMDRFLDGTGGGNERESDEDTDDVLKLGLKQLTPILKTYVEKTLDKETKGGVEPSPDRVKQIYAEAAQKAAQQLAIQMQRDGLMTATTQDGRLVAIPAPKKVAVPPRHAPAKVLSERATAEGFVKTVQIQPENFSKKQAPRPAGPSPTHVATPKSIQEEEEVVKVADFPGLGPNGGTIKVEIPPKPGDMKYDRKRSVDFILDSIRSEIKQNVPQDSKNESFVPADALDLLDSEVLDRLASVDSGDQLEALLAEWGDKTKIEEIKVAGQDEIVKSWLRRLVSTISDAHIETKKVK